MGDSVMTAKRALKIGRFQLQHLHLHDATSAEHAASLSRIDSAAASTYMDLARFFLANASPREPEITDLLAEIDEVVDDAPSAVHSASASLSTSDVSVTMGSRLRQGSTSYEGPFYVQQAMAARPPASPPTAGGSLAARSNSERSMV